MATAILRPNGDINSTWTITGETTRWGAIDDAVTQPTAGTTTDRIATSTSGVQQNLNLTTVSGVDTVTAATIWMYNSTAGNDRILASLHLADGTQVGTTSAATNMTTSYVWYSHTITGISLTQTQLDGLYLRLTSGNIGGMSEVRCAAAYVDITYTEPYIPVISGAYATAVAATSGLQAYWRLGESTGTTAYDDSGNNRHGTNSGATIGATGLLTSDTNTAYSFDGVNDQITFGPASWSDIPIVTVEAWVNTTTTATGTPPIIVRANVYDVYLVNGEVRSWLYGVGAELATGITVNDGNPHHIVMRIEFGVTNGATIYIDGTLRATGTPGARGTATNLFIGSNGTSAWFSGVIDEVALYNVLLPEATITAHYNAGAGISSGDPKSAPDSQAVTSSDTATRAASSTVADTQAVGSTDTATRAATSTVADTQALASSDSASRLETAAKAAPDSQAIASTDTATRAAASIVADTQGIASTESATGAATSAVGDAQGITSTDTATHAATATVGDSTAIGSSENTSISEQATKGATDAQAIASTDNAAITEQGTKASIDAQALASADTVTTGNTSATTDAQGLASVDSALLAIDGTVPTDTTIIESAEGITLVVTGAAADTQALASTESVSVAVVITVDDLQALDATELASWLESTDWEPGPKLGLVTRASHATITATRTAHDSLHVTRTAHPAITATREQAAPPLAVARAQHDPPLAVARVASLPPLAINRVSHEPPLAVSREKE